MFFTLEKSHEKTYNLTHIKTLELKTMAIERITEFLEVARKTKMANLAGLASSEVDYLRPNYEISSLKKSLTNYRNAVKNSALKDASKKIIIENLILLDSEKADFTKAGVAKVDNDLRNLRPLYDIDGYLIHAEKLLNAPSYIDVIIGLCVLTGRRTAEIGCSATFEKIENDDTGVLFTGQLKTKGRGSLDAYRIPVLGNVDKIINALNNIRKSKPDLLNSPDIFHNRCSKEISGKVKKHFPKISNSLLTPKDMRSIYAEISYFYADDSTIAKSKYMSSILGHSEDDNVTGLSYVDFYIVED